MLFFSYSPQRAPRLLPLMRWSVEAGFPSPAEGQIDEALDLNELLIEHPPRHLFCQSERRLHARCRDSSR